MAQYYSESPETRAESVGYFDICILQAAGNLLAKEPVGSAFDTVIIAGRKLLQAALVLWGSQQWGPSDLPLWLGGQWVHVWGWLSPGCCSRISLLGVRAWGINKGQVWGMSRRDGFGSSQGWGCLLACTAVLHPSSQRMFLLQSLLPRGFSRTS